VYRHRCETIAIHAAKGYPKWARDFALQEHYIGRIPDRIPLSAIVATARVVDCKRTEEIAGTLNGLERHLGDYSWGRWAWVLEDVHALREPIPCAGALGFWRVPENVEAKIREELRCMN
jgi:hypothetical protein